MILELHREYPLFQNTVRFKLYAGFEDEANVKEEKAIYSSDKD
jgi:hypothetical protein